MASKLLPVIILSVFFCYTLKAQTTFQTTYGGSGDNEASSLQPSNNGGYIISAYTNSFNSKNYAAYLIAIDSLGNPFFYEAFSGEGVSIAASAQQTSDAGYIVTGTTYDPGVDSGDIYLVKTDAFGDTIWTKTFGSTGNNGAHHGQQTFDNGFIVAGYTTGFGAGSYDGYLLKIDSIGNLLWGKTYGGPKNDGFFFVKQTTDSGYIMVGRTKSFGAGGFDVYLVKTNAFGDTLWTKTYGGSGDDEGHVVKQTSDGGYIISAITNSFGAIGNEVYLIKTDSIGNLTWSKTYGGITGSANAAGVQQTDDGGYLITGSSNSFGAGGNDVYLIKTNAIGDTLWTKAYGGTGNDGGKATQLAKNGYVILGTDSSFGATAGRIYLIKTDSNGNSDCNEYTTQTIVDSPTTTVGSTKTVVDTGGRTRPNNTIVYNGGSETTLCTSGIDMLLNTPASVTIYPDPVNRIATISIAGPVTKGTIFTLYDILGRTIKQFEIDNTTTIFYRNNIPSGIYLYRITQQQVIVTGKVVME